MPSSGSSPTATTRLFVGTLGPAKPTFVVTGLFYPKADRQTRLFN
jgi:hypothetical protein